MTRAEYVKEVIRRLSSTGWKAAAETLAQNPEVSSLLDLRETNGVWQVYLHGQMVSIKKQPGLSAVANRVDELRHLVPRMNSIRGAVGKSVASHLAHYRGIHWLLLSRPYTRLQIVLDASRRSAAGEQLLLDCCLTELGQVAVPDINQADRVARRLMNSLGLKEQVLTSLMHLAEFSDEGILVEVLEALFHPAPVDAYRLALITQMLCSARITLPVNRVTAIEHVRESLNPVIGYLLQRCSDRSGMEAFLDYLLQDGMIAGPSQRDLLKILWAVAKGRGAHDLAYAIANRVRAKSAADNPSSEIQASKPARGSNPPRVAASFDWEQISRIIGATDPGIPDDVMRSLLEATIRKATEDRVYGLPEVDFWVACPDPYLQGLGIDRFTFRGGPEVDRIQGITASTRVQFPLGIPPAEVRGGALFLLLMGATMFAALVTQRDRFSDRRGTKETILTWSGGGRTPRSARTISIARQATRTHTVNPAFGGGTPTPRAGTYVVPHMRALRNGGQPTESAVEGAREHGISLPRGYTFVRGHFRGAASEVSSPKYALVDITLETIRRFRNRRPSAGRQFRT